MRASADSAHSDATLTTNRTPLERLMVFGPPAILYFGVIFATIGVARTALLELTAPVIGMVIILVEHALSQTRIQVGSDGVRFTRFGRDRFVAYHAVQDIRRHRYGFDVVLRDGSRVEVGGLLASSLSRKALAACGPMYETISSALAAYRGSGSPHAILPAQSDAPEHDAWIAALREIAQRPGGYRSGAASTEALYEVLRDPASAPERRAAAAYVLRLRVPTEACASIRVVAATTVEPALRDTLHAVADAAETPGVGEALRKMRAP